MLGWRRNFRSGKPCRTKEALETVERFSRAKELDQKIVDALIEKVLVYDPGHVEIRWKFSDEIMKMMQE